MRYSEILKEYNQAATIKNLGQRMVARYQSDRDRQFDKEDPELAPKLVQYFEDIDPTKKKAFTKFLCQWYAKGSMRYLEDASKALEPIELYAKFKNRLQGINLDQITFDRFLDLGDELRNTKSGKEEDRSEEQAFYDSGDAVLFFDSSEIKITIPKTKEASVYFGRNTRWCTAAKNNNLFDSYNNDGPLYIILFKKSNTRWQIHFETGAFMDERDLPLAPDLVKSNAEIQHLFKENFVDVIENHLHDDSNLAANNEKPVLCLNYVNPEILTLEQILKTSAVTTSLVKGASPRILALGEEEKNEIVDRHPALVLVIPQLERSPEDRERALGILGFKDLLNSEECKVFSVSDPDKLLYLGSSVAAARDRLRVMTKMFMIQWTDDTWLLALNTSKHTSHRIDCVSESHRKVNRQKFRNNEALQEMFGDQIMEIWHLVKDEKMSFQDREIALELLKPSRFSFKEALETAKFSNAIISAYAAGFSRLTDERLIGLVTKMPWVFASLPEDQVQRVPADVAFACYKDLHNFEGAARNEAGVIKNFLRFTPNKTEKQIIDILDDESGDYFTMVNDPSPAIQQAAAKRLRYSVAVEELIWDDPEDYTKAMLDHFTDPTAIKIMCATSEVRKYYQAKGLFKADA